MKKAIHHRERARLSERRPNVRAARREALAANANVLLPLMPDDLLTSISGPADARGRVGGWGGQTQAPLVSGEDFNDKH